MTDAVNSYPSLSARAKELRRPNLKAAVADSIRELIFSGALRPGSKIDQDEIAEQLGISKLPVREALITLEGEGLVKSIPRRGAFIAALQREDIQDHFSIYGMVAGLAAERAALFLQSKTIEDLASLVATMEGTSSPEEKEKANFHFHRIINSAGGSLRLIAVLRVLSKSIPTRFFERTPGWAAVAQQHHRAILKALRDQDGAEARRLTEVHLRESGAYAIAYLEERGFWKEEATA